jgi:hypothetical protein
MGGIMKKKERVTLSKSCENRLSTTRRATMAPQLILEEPVETEVVYRGEGPRSLNGRLRVIKDQLGRCRVRIPEELRINVGAVAVIPVQLQVIEGMIDDLLKEVGVNHQTGVEYIDGWGR